MKTFQEIAQPIVNHVCICGKCLHATDDTKLCDNGKELKQEADLALYERQLIKRGVK